MDFETQVSKGIQSCLRFILKYYITLFFTIGPLFMLAITALEAYTGEHYNEVPNPFPHEFSFLDLYHPLLVFYYAGVKIPKNCRVGSAWIVPHLIFALAHVGKTLLRLDSLLDIWTFHALSHFLFPLTLIDFIEKYDKNWIISLSTVCFVANIISPIDHKRLTNEDVIRELHAKLSAQVTSINTAINDLAVASSDRDVWRNKYLAEQSAHKETAETHSTLFKSQDATSSSLSASLQQERQKVKSLTTQSQLDHSEITRLRRLLEVSRLQFKRQIAVTDKVVLTTTALKKAHLHELFCARLEVGDKFSRQLWESRNSRVAKRLTTVKSELTTTKSKLTTTRSELVTTRSELVTTKSELAATKSELATTKSELATTSSELATTSSKLSTTKSELATTKSKLATTGSELATTGSELATTKSELATTRSELSTVKSELVAKDTIIASLQAKPAENQDDSEKPKAAQSELIDKDASTKPLDVSLAETEAKLAAPLKLGDDAEKLKLAQSEIETQKSTITSLEAKLAEALKPNEDAEKLRLAQSEIDTQKATITSLEAKLAEARKLENNAFKHEKLKLNNTILCRDQDIRSLKHQLEDSRADEAELDRITHELKYAKLRIETLEAKVVELKTNVATEDEKLEKIQERNAGMNDDLAMWESFLAGVAEILGVKSDDLHFAKFNRFFSSIDEEGIRDMWNDWLAANPSETEEVEDLSDED
ncbi:hypothetical protein Vi05172_g12252 [Venturia inaequalis]|nr:hypothetical protein Vi05172_g12252 [Venturia inaequalis]